MHLRVCLPSPSPWVTQYSTCLGSASYALEKLHRTRPPLWKRCA